MGAARRLVRLPWRDRFLLVETIVLLGFAAICIALLSFSTVTKIAAGRSRARPPASPAEARRIAWAVNACARRVPWRAVCFQRGLAAQLLLRRRRLHAVLCYGIRPDRGDGLAAHVWVRSGDADIVGCEAAADYRLVATFGG